MVMDVIRWSIDYNLIISFVFSDLLRFYIFNRSIYVLIPV